ncbi:pyruvate kinase [Brunnivagina elsteri]|uniref:Pyruvate kinase n=1 Tax=Brunnivagina elsteri CCALA 953 TaxID=987040 RepID=A0A2A2T9X3_9CYAN|nr:pyruvate kinase [Calothrix elsteri]PAX45762.1 pyruvate kinase [Calothrix elsteri CCALA 953]
MLIAHSEINRHLICDYSSLDLSNPEILLNALQQLRQLVIQEGEEIFNQWRSRIQRQNFLQSSQNLAYYLALRRHDLRPLQAALMPWGLSSLGRIEARVLPNLDAAIATLGAICGSCSDSLPNRPSLAAFFEGDRLLEQHTEDLLDAKLNQRRVRIMVTLPTEAASYYEFVRDLIQRGTNCVRINCAHDTSAEWSAMIANVRIAEAETGHSCKVLMDLGGPKPRIGIARCLRHAGANAPNAKQRIFRGECLLLTRDLPTTNESTCFQVNCTIPEILDQLEVGASVWIDDGHIGARVESITEEGVLLRITHARIKGEKLGADKGLNFPDTTLRFSPLTQKDRQDLDFVATHADIVGYSFVQEPADIELLQRELQARLPINASIPGIIAKIETPLAVSNLPELIVQAAGKQPLGATLLRIWCKIKE